MPWPAALLVGLGCGWPITTQLKTTINKTQQSLGFRPDLSQTTFGSRKRTRFGTWNIRTLLKTTTLAQLTKEFRRYHLEILGLCETRWPEQGERRASTGEHIIFSGRPTNEARASGVGIMMSKEARKSLLDWHPVSDRIIVARFASKIRQVVCVQTYAPTEAATAEEKDLFYSMLHDSLDKLRKSDIVILMGDLNAKVGNNNTGWETVMGKHGLGNMNDNGERFAELCTGRNLVIGGTLFPHRDVHKETWVSPDRVTKNQIDHIAISKRWRSSLLDVSNRRGADVFSDHHLLVGMVKLKLSSTRKRHCNRKKPDLGALKDSAVKQQYASSVQQSLSEISRPNVEEKWDEIVKAYTENANSILGFPDRTRKEWISDSTWNLINERRAVKGQLNTMDGNILQHLRARYSELDKLVSRSARHDKRVWLEDIAAQAQQASERRDYSAVFRLTRQISNKCLPHDYPVKKLDGTLAVMEEQQLIRWTEHFEQVLNCASPGPPNSPINNPAELPYISATCPTMMEIKSAITSLKDGKASGSDNIYAELLKSDVELATRTLHEVLGEIWEDELIPTSMKEGLIVKIPKKGDLANCANWRGITLQNTVNKILSNIIGKRIQEVIEPVLRKEQAGFRPNRSCTDQINTMRIIIEQSVEYRSPLYVVFVDFERAFDSVGRNMMWQILYSYGIPDKLITLIRELYRDSSCRVLHKGNPGNSFPIYSGVKQGCSLSPLLFIIVLDWIMKKIDRDPRGITWNVFHRLGDLDYADDIAFVTHSAADMQIKLNQLVLYAKQVGLKINVNKTKLLRVNRRGFCNLTVEDQQIEEVSEFCYLGSVLSIDGGANNDVKARINKGRRSFGMLANIWRSPQFSTNLKLNIFRSNVVSVLLYGCETWKVTSTIVSRLQVFVNRCLRRLLKVRWSDKVRNEELWRRSNMVGVGTIIKKRKWSWIGHTLRKPVSDVTRQALDWNPQGSRRVGRPSMTWKRSVELELSRKGTTWNNIKSLAQRRVRWKGFVEDLCSLEE